MGNCFILDLIKVNAMVLKRELAFFAVIIFFALAISLSALNLDDSNPLALTRRLLALNGYLALSIAAILTPFLKEVTLFFKKSFITVHHYFAAAGLLLITLHPVTVAISFLSLNVLLPNFASLYSFFFYGGSIALILIYLSFGAVLLRRKIAAYWRYFHAFIYVALFFGVVHANLWGLDFEDSFTVMVVYDGLFAVMLAAFVLKRLQFYRIKQKRKNAANNHPKTASEPQKVA
jgi:methionine sulfoxide reductase heme-binding subunit